MHVGHKIKVVQIVQDHAADAFITNLQIEDIAFKTGGEKSPVIPVKVIGHIQKLVHAILEPHTAKEMLREEMGIGITVPQPDHRALVQFPSGINSIFFTQCRSARIEKERLYRMVGDAGVYD